jgi:hypothetical protein
MIPDFLKGRICRSFFSRTNDCFAISRAAFRFYGVRISRLAHSSVQPSHPEMAGVPIHTQLDLPDTGLRFGVWERSCFHRMVECVFHIQELSPVATSDSTHSFFLRQPPA